MKTALHTCAAVLALGLIGNASAADLKVKAPIYKAPPPASVWQGFYVGGHVGYLWSRTDVFDTGVLVESGAQTNGGIGGVLAGYNWQVSNIVLGLEGDVGWADAHGTGASQNFVIPNAYDLDWSSHLRGRLGIAPGPYPVLLFIAGGAAFSHFKFTSGETGESTTTTYTGASIGGGVDFAMANQITLRGEWLHDFYMGNGALIEDYKADLKSVDTARGAFIYRFNP